MDKTQRRKSTIIMLIVLALFWLLPTQRFTSSVVQNESTQTWLEPGAYMEYKALGSTGIWRYNSSLSPINSSIALENYDFLETSVVHPEEGDVFVYRWTVISVSDESVVFEVFANVTNWIEQIFVCTLNLTSYSIQINSETIGVFYPWLPSSDYDSLHIISSNPSLSFIQAAYTIELTPTIQGIQEHVQIDARNYDFDFRTMIGFDASTGLILSLNIDSLLPFPLESRFICLIGTIELTATNIDLGPDILLPDYGGIWMISGIAAGIIILTIVFYIARRRQFRRKRRKIKRKKRRS